MARENASEAPMLCAKRRAHRVAMAATVAVLTTPAGAQQALEPEQLRRPVQGVCS